MKYIHLYALLLMLVFCITCRGQVKTDHPKIAAISGGPKWITRNIIQDRKGNIWIAAFDGIFQYDGKSFSNITSKVSSARFFSVLEDRKGNLWFGSIGSGVYEYDGKSFKNFTTRDGLAGNSVTCIYEDKTGNIWFGASRYDGKSFRNFTTKDGLSNNDVNSVIEDKTGKFWFGTDGNACIYDGKKFTVLTHEGKPFTNVRTIIEDKKGNIWIGGTDGLWRYDGKTFTNFTSNFVGYIYEDKKGNIWTSSQNINAQDFAASRYDQKALPALVNVKAKGQCLLSRYDEKSLSDKKPTVTEIATQPMIFGILEANDGNIWFGALNGVYRYDGNTITGFNDINKSPSVTPWN